MNNIEEEKEEEISEEQTEEKEDDEEVENIEPQSQEINPEENLPDSPIVNDLEPPSKEDLNKFEEDSLKTETPANEELEQGMEAGELTENEGELIDEVSSNLQELDSLEEPEEEKQARIERELKDFQKCMVEAALYAAGKPLSVEDLSTKLDLKKKETEELLNELAFDYLERSTSLVIVQMGDRYQMQIKPEYTEKVSKFAEGGAIPQGILRTLTIIALKQPILKSLVIKLRGAGAYDHIKWLQEQQLVDATKKGRSHELTTTDKYSEMFGLPKDKTQMKQVMIAQLGVDAASPQDDETPPE